MTTCDICIELNEKPVLACEDASPEIEKLWITRFSQPETFSLSQWEEELPQMKENITNYLRLTTSRVVDDTPQDIKVDTYVREIVWTRAKSVEYASSDGWKITYHITEDPICFVYEFGRVVQDPDSDSKQYGRLMEHLVEKEGLGNGSHIVQPRGFILKKDSIRGSHMWLMQDIIATSPQTNYVADLKFTRLNFTNSPGKIVLDLNWGFNGANAVLIFREMCEKYRKPSLTELSGGVVVIHLCTGIGAWMQDNLRAEEIVSLSSKVFDHGEPVKEDLWNGSIVI